MAVSKRLRYEILRRDNNACKTCGRTPPEVKLHVDHVIPVTLGGSDEPSNLQALCSDCNGGKSSVPADAPLVQDVADKALEWAEAMRIVAEERAVKRAKSEKHYAKFKREWNSWKDWRGNPEPLDPAWKRTVDTLLDAGLEMEDLIGMLEVAMSAKAKDTWKYFCGCCWKQLAQIQDRAAQVMNGPLAEPKSGLTQLPTVWTIDDMWSFITGSLDTLSEKLGKKVRFEDLTCEHGPECEDLLCRLCCAASLMGHFHDYVRPEAVGADG